MDKATLIAKLATKKFYAYCDEHRNFFGAEAFSFQQYLNEKGKTKYGAFNAFSEKEFAEKLEDAFFRAKRDEQVIALEGYAHKNVNAEDTARFYENCAFFAMCMDSEEKWQCVWGNKQWKLNAWGVISDMVELCYNHFDKNADYTARALSHFAYARELAEEDARREEEEYIPSCYNTADYVPFF